MKRTWMPAAVGCHWFAADRQIAISTIRYAPVDHYHSTNYGLWVDCELVAEFATLKAAQRFADNAFPVAPVEQVA